MSGFTMYHEWQQWSGLKKCCVSSIALFVLYSFVGFLLLPWIIKDQLEKRGRVVTARQVEVADVYVNPYIFRVRIQGVNVLRKNSDESFVRFAELAGTVHWLPLIFQQTLKFSSVELKDPAIHLTRYADGQLSISDLLSRDQSERYAAEMAETTTAVVSFALYDVAVSNGSIVFDDQLKSFTHEITAINLGLPSISDREDRVEELVTPSFSAIVNGTLFDFSGESKPFADNRETGIALTCKDLDLSLFQPYVPESIPFILTSAKLDFSLNTKSRYVPDAERWDLSAQGELRLHDVLIDDKQGERVAAVSSVDLSIGSADLYTQTLRLNKVRVQRPELYLERQADGQIKFSSLFGGGNDETQASPSAFLLEAGEVVISDGLFVLVDLVPEQAATHRVQQFELALDSFSTAEESLFGLDLNFVANGSGRVKMDGKVGVLPLQVQLEGEVQKFPLASGQSYIAEQAVVVVRDGFVSSAFSVAGEMTDQGMDFQVSGDVRIDDLVILEGEYRPEVVGFKSLQAAISVKNNPFLLQVKEVRLDNPRTHVEVRKDGTVNLALLAREKKEAGEPLQSPPEPGSHLSGRDGRVELGLFTVSNGQLLVDDRSISPFYQTEVTELAGTVSDVSTLVADGGPFEFTAVFDHHSPLVMKGHVNPFPPNRFLDVDVKFSDIEMSPFTPYSRRFIGRDLTKGKLSLKQQIKVQKRTIDIDTNIYLDQLGLGDYEANETATTLPVGLAVALLQDRQGVISFDVPIAGRLDDPEFGVGGAVVSALVNLVTKAATSPFSLLGSMFSGDGESQFITFLAGDVAIDAEQQTSLQAFAKALYDRPGLKVEISSQYQPGVEQGRLVEMKFMELLSREKRKATGGETLEPVQAGDEYDRYLLEAYRNGEFKRPRNMIGMLEVQTPEVMTRMLKANIEVTPGEIRLLALQRGEAVASLLRTHGPVESERLFVLEPVEIEEGAPRVELRFQ